jgi:hypothetical protein
MDDVFLKTALPGNVGRAVHKNIDVLHGVVKPKTLFLLISK